ncbi:hypothetical protein SLS53_003624 [Cytospora paraplurivora]|uniref:Uncharacterized protein n=1 Tax=Cytospora paraplurivora TaxID=2898453 RepID=A0AAN9UAP3_9PEZI
MRVFACQARLRQQDTALGKVAKLEEIARKGGDFALEVVKKRVAEQDTTTRKDFLTKVLARCFGLVDFP